MITPTFILGIIPIVMFYVHQQIVYTRTYRVLKRVDAVRRSPQYSWLNETLDGLKTVRCFKVDGQFLKRMMTLLDHQQTAYFLACTAQCWLALRLELSGLLIVAVTFLALVRQHSNDAGDAQFVGVSGLAVSLALSVTQALCWSVRMGADLEAQIVSVERIQYRNIPAEAPLALLSDKAIDPSWPFKGEIHFINCSLQYNINAPLVLRGISFIIPPNAKVGCCGRTGEDIPSVFNHRRFPHYLLITKYQHLVIL